MKTNVNSGSGFIQQREALGDQYVKAWHNEECYKRVDKLNDDAMEYVKQLKDIPHSVIKAKGLNYILQNAEIYINPDDPFGIALVAQKMDPIGDFGCHYLDTFIRRLQRKWTNDLQENLYPMETKSYLKNTLGYMLDEMYIDYNHSTPSWDSLLTLGFNGILERVKEYEKKLRDEEELTQKQEDYFVGIYETYDAIFAFLDRVIKHLEKYETNTAKRMRQAFCNLRNNPPSEIYEALLFAWFYWYVQEFIEGQRVRSMGGIDRLYYPFYKKAIESGEYTKDEIVDLFAYFMNEFYAFRTAYQQPMFLGGCDENGNCIVNELTYVILDAYNLLSRPNPKLQAIIGENTPQEFLMEVMKSIRKGNSSFSIINDDIVKSALMKLGIPAKEATTYIMSGCWDFQIKDHEVKTIPVRVNFAKMVELAMTDGRCLSTNEITGIQTGLIPKNFDDFMKTFWMQFDYTWNKVRSIIENWEKYLDVINPSNMYSATMTDSLKQAKDGYAYGMKYNTTVYTLAGIATVIDSLLSIKHYVYEQRRLTLEEFVEVLKQDWKGYEKLRQDILNDNSKYGNGDKEADALMVEVTQTIADKINGLPNGRRGFWKIGLLSIDKNVRYGAVSKATPDGRKAGEPFSKNMNPSLGMDKGGITVTMNSLTKIDFTKFPHAAMVDFVVHPTAVSGDDGLKAFAALVRTYFKKGGHSMQLNVFDRETLVNAQQNPDKYRNLQVRVCGWNVYFVELEKALQDEFIARSK